MGRRIGTFRTSAPLVVLALLAALLVSAASAGPSSGGSASAQATTLGGRVRSGATALPGLSVDLLATATGGPTTLGSTTAAADGSFEIPYTAPADPDAVLYLLARNQSTPPDLGAITLASVLGTSPVAADVVVNERTTVASAFAMAQFTDAGVIAGSAPGLQSAAEAVADLVEVTTGDPGSALATLPNASAVGALNSLANMVAACVATSDGCDALFGAAAPPGGPSPTDTLGAMVDVARHPSQSTDDLFAVSILPPAPYQPALTEAPYAWTVVSAAGGEVSAQAATLTGLVLSDATPLMGFRVDLLATTPGGPTILGTATTAADGSFGISYVLPPDPDAVLYLLARNQATPPDPGVITLASVLGTAPVAADVVVNERTTVASAFAMAQFTDGGAIGGSAPGLQNAAGMARNLVDVATGGPSVVLATSPNGSETSTIKDFGSLANMLARCIGTPADCALLFAAAIPPGGPPPTDTFQAMGDVARNPFRSLGDVAALFAISLLAPAPYTPARVVPPAAWTLALRFIGDGMSVDGPGNIAIDHEGNLWVNNNYIFGADESVPVCGGKTVFKFTPTGQFFPGSPYSGGGLNGAGWGIGIDPFGDIWVGNFGFFGDGCPVADRPLANSVSQFRPDGTPVSPSATATSGGGWTQGGVAAAQATVSDREGNIWIANCEADTVTRYPGGDPERAQEIRDIGLEQPLGIAFNNDGAAFVTGTASSTVAMLFPDGSPTPISPITGGGLNKPLGIAADSAGNMWVANQSSFAPPCGTLVASAPSGGSLTLLHPDGRPASPTSFTGGGLTLAWGIAVDGNDNVWVANFAEKRLSHFCGVPTTACPLGAARGDPISPDATGYFFDGLTRVTGVAIDPSGNVWLLNNWKEIPVQTNPGGLEIVAFVGLAGPVNVPPPRPRPVAATPTFTG